MGQQITKEQVQALVVDTVRDPAHAARQILQLDLPRRWLWTALGLMCVLNAIVYSISLQLFPPDPAVLSVIPPAFRSPMLFTIFLFGTLVITVFTLQWIGQAMGGKASLGDILILLTWVQVLRLLLQVVVLVLTLVSPGLAALLVFIASVWGIYILASFLNEAHGFENLIKAIGVMLLALAAIVVGLSLILAVISTIIIGSAGYV